MSWTDAVCFLTVSVKLLTLRVKHATEKTHTHIHTHEEVHGSGAAVVVDLLSDLKSGTGDYA